MTPFGIFSFGNAFLVKMIIGSSFVPSAQRARTTVRCVFSRPPVLAAKVYALLTPTVLLHSTSKVSGTSSYWWFGTAASLSKIYNIRIKFQNLILIDCWKFGGKFHSCPQAQTYSLYKVKAPFRCPWEIINVFLSCNPFTFFLCHLGRNREPSLMLLYNLGHHLLLHIQPLILNFPLPWHLKKFFSLLPPQSDDTLWEEVQTVTWQLCCHAS